MSAVAWPTAQLGEVLAPVARERQVDPSREYPLLGVRLDGQGPFHRETVLGTQTSASRLYEVKAGDFIYSRLFAWRGAFGLIEPELDGHFVSNEFPTFAPRNGRIDPKYLRYWFRLPDVLRRVEADCSGSTPLTRNRYKEQYFYALEITLPPLDEQRRIVVRIEELAAKVEEARRMRAVSEIEMEALRSSDNSRAFQALYQQFETTSLRELISLSSGENLTASQMSDDAPYAVFGGGGLNGRYTQYLFEEEKIGIGRVGARCGCVFVTEPHSWITDNALYVEAFSERLLRDYLVFALEMLDLRQEANQAAQPVVSQKKILPLKIPVPSIQVQQQVVAERNSFQAKLDAVKALQTETAAELDTMLPAILDKAFKGEL